MIVGYFLFCVSGSFFMNHLIMRWLSGRDLTRADAVMFAWSFLYLGYLLIVYWAALPAAGTLDDKADYIVRLAALVGLPALATGVIAWRAWGRLWPGVAILIAATIIPALRPLTQSVDIWFIGTPIIWNAAYAGACLPIALEQRHADAYARAARCECGYPSTGLPEGAPCPECGRTDDVSQIQPSF